MDPFIILDPYQWTYVAKVIVGGGAACFGMFALSRKM